MTGYAPAELAARVKDPADLPKFEKLYKLMDRRLEKLGPDAGPAVTVAATMKVWRRVFGVEWPKTRVEPAVSAST